MFQIDNALHTFGFDFVYFQRYFMLHWYAKNGWLSYGIERDKYILYGIQWKYTDVHLIELSELQLVPQTFGHKMTPIASVSPTPPRVYKRLFFFYIC